MPTSILVLGLILFAAVLLTIGLLGLRATKAGTTEYFVAGRTLNTFVVVFTLSASMLSAILFVGTPAAMYAQGIGAHFLVALIALQGLMFYIVGTKLWVLGKKFNFINISDLIAVRYQSNALALLIVIALIVGIVPYVAAQIIGAGSIVEGMSLGALPRSLGIAVIVLAIMFYAVAGGMRSVAWTDVVQGVVMLVALYVAMFMLIAQLPDGLGPALDDIRRESPDLLSIPGPDSTYTYLFLGGMYLMWGLGVLMRVDQAQRIYSARSIEVVKRNAVLFPLLTLVFIVPIYFIAMAGRALVPAGRLDNPNLLMPTLIGEYLPAGLVVVVLIGTMAAMMSTADSQVLGASSLIIKDVYQRFINATPRDSTVTLYSRIVTVVVLLGATLIAVYGPQNIVELLSDISFPIWVQVFPLLFFGLFWRRGTKQAAYASLLVGEFVMVSLSLEWWSLPYLLPGIWGLLFGIGVFVVVSLMTKPVDERVIRMFFPEPAPASEMDARERTRA